MLWRYVPSAEAKKAEGTSDYTTMSDSQATISDRQDGLGPLDIGEISVGDGEDTVSELFVKLAECSMSVLVH